MQYSSDPESQLYFKKAIRIEAEKIYRQVMETVDKLKSQEKISAEERSIAKELVDELERLIG